LGAGEATPSELLDIDGSVPGQVFRTERIEREPAPAGNGTRMWAPLVDGADRLGVLGATVADADERTAQRLLHMASITAGLLVSKSEFGDNLVLTRRVRDVDLAAEMRWSMLPPLTFNNDRVAVAGMLEPAYEIAGDAFDYAINGETAHVAIIDAMGHGLEARSADGEFFGRRRLARMWQESLRTASCQPRSSGAVPWDPRPPGAGSRTRHAAHGPVEGPTVGPLSPGSSPRWPVR
jgi:hypothetical protein